MAMAESIAEYLCSEELFKNMLVCINYSEDPRMDFYITEQSSSTVKKYVNGGGELREKLFVLCSKTVHNIENAAAADISDFFEALSDRLYENNKNGILPEPGRGLVPISIRAGEVYYRTRTSYESTKGYFALEIRLRYFKK